MLPHEDLEASLAFYRDTLGFEVRNDVEYGGMHWLTVGPPNQPDTSIVLYPPAATPGLTDDERRMVAEMMAKGTYASINLATRDLDGTFERRGRGRPGADRAALRDSRLLGPGSRGQPDPDPAAALSRFAGRGRSVRAPGSAR
jgi:catechol 2,3-dioxygenase-like lactoylglutathione lyase family enzyme